MANEKKPLFVPKELVEELERLWPDRVPRLGTPMDKVWYDAGQVNVVQWLRRKYEENEKRALEGSK